MEKQLLGPEWIDASVSTGTLRRADLIPAFIDVLAEVDKDKARKYNDEYGTIDFDSDKGMSEADELLMELFDALEAIAPEWFGSGYIYFGAHPGDGADFGFWVEDY